MVIALIDNGSLEPAAHRNLRGVATTLSEKTGAEVHAVSWKHSDRIPAAALDGRPAWTVRAFVSAWAARGERDFVFIPFFISPQGAIGSALRGELEGLQRELGGFAFRFTSGLVERGILPAIVAARIRATIAAASLVRPPVIVVDHGGPSAASAALRDLLAVQIRDALGAEIGPLAAASLEGEHAPLLAEQLHAPGFAAGGVVVAPLFLAPGRHAGPAGDIAQICADAPARCHVTELVGTHPLAADALAAGLQATLSLLHADSFA